MAISSTKTRRTTALLTAGATIATVAALTPFGSAAINATPSQGEPWTGVEGEALLPRTRSMPAPRTVGTPAGARVRGPSWVGAIRLSAGWAYSNGYKHRAWDVAVPLGTPVYAPRNGVVIGYNDGVANNPYGYNPGSNSPSNWVLLCHTIGGKQISSYWQHLSPGIKVKVGQTVRGPRFNSNGVLVAGTGTLLANSGNTGNSTGPHLHVAAFVGCAKPTTAGANTPAGWSRYNYLNYPSKLIWEPNRLWARPRIEARNLIVATRTWGSSQWVPLIRQLAGDKSKSTLADRSFRITVRSMKRKLGLKVNPIPDRVFLRTWANQNNAFTFYN